MNKRYYDIPWATIPPDQLSPNMSPADKTYYTRIYELEVNVHQLRRRAERMDTVLTVLVIGYFFCILGLIIYLY